MKNRITNPETTNTQSVSKKSLFKQENTLCVPKIRKIMGSIREIMGRVRRENTSLTICMPTKALHYIISRHYHLLAPAFFRTFTTAL